LLAHLVQPKGKVYAVEKIPGLVEFGRANCERAGVANVEFHEAGEQVGLHEFAPYDRILVSAAADTLPMELCDQLTDTGRMVIPIGSKICVLDKSSSDSFDTTEHPGFMFVPLVH
jgi:protein-L-isoaspartate(D-aspartate) O-methyltransferase